MSTVHEVTQTKAHTYGPPVVVEVLVKIQAVAFQEADGRYSIVVPELPGCVSCGEDLDEAKANIIEAAEGWLAVGHDLNREQSIRNVTEPFPGEVEP